MCKVAERDTAACWIGDRLMLHQKLIKSYHAVWNLSDKTSSDISMQYILGGETSQGNTGDKSNANSWFHVGDGEVVRNKSKWKTSFKKNGWKPKKILHFPLLL